MVCRACWKASCSASACLGYWNSTRAFSRPFTSSAGTPASARHQHLCRALLYLSSCPRWRPARSERTPELCPPWGFPPSDSASCARPCVGSLTTSCGARVHVSHHQVSVSLQAETACAALLTMKCASCCGSIWRLSTRCWPQSKAQHQDSPGHLHLEKDSSISASHRHKPRAGAPRSAQEELPSRLNFPLVLQS